ncbi:MAG: hypothetical protein V1750_05310, partial [Acidobacteriota bacterium]
VEEAEDSSFAGAARVVATDPIASFSHPVSSSKTYYYRVVAKAPCGPQTLASPLSNVAATRVEPPPPPAPMGEPLYVPAAAHTSGVKGSQWRTDISLYNPGAESVGYTVELLQDGATSTGETRGFSLPAGQAVAHTDILSSVFGISGVAALRIGSEGALVVSGRTYNQTAQGTFGQLIRAKRQGDAARAGEIQRLFPLASSATRDRGFRTNLGFVNPSAVEVVIEASLYRGNGARVATQIYTLKPGAFVQVTDVFGKAGAGDVEAGYAEIVTTTPDGAFFAYASVIDNISGDPLYIAAR